MSPSDKQIRSFTEWLNDTLTPGQERDLNRWLADEPSNQDAWDAWQRINGRAKRLQVVPNDAKEQWALLRDELGFQHTEKRRKKSSRSSSGKEFYRRPSLIALVSMIVYSIFLFVLHLIRTNVGF